MSTIISASLDLSKVDKSKIKHTDKGGQYYNFTIIVNDSADKFGNNVSLSDNQSKEEVATKAKKKYLGSGKVVWTNGQISKPTEDSPF